MEKAFILIKATQPGAQTPTKGTVGSAGFDLFACLNQIQTILPGDRALIPTGICMAIPQGLYGRIAPRSGLAWNWGIHVMAGVIDSDYRGEIGVILQNSGSNPFKVEPNAAIAQIIFEMHHPFVVLNPTSPEHFDLLTTKRGEGGFGSTDNED